jgi:hypothetical protein
MLAVNFKDIPREQAMVIRRLRDAHALLAEREVARQKAWAAFLAAKDASEDTRESLYQLERELVDAIRMEALKEATVKKPRGSRK